jgi:hypothetical protein
MKGNKRAKKVAQRTATRSLPQTAPPALVSGDDVGYESLVGISVTWDATVPGFGRGFGDATFPDLSRASLRSIPNRTPSELIYADVTSELMLGIAPDINPEEARSKLSQLGLQAIEISGTMATAKQTDGACCGLPCSTFPRVAVDVPVPV